MAAQIKYLSIDLVIGGYELVLETDSDKNLAVLDGTTDVKTQIIKALQTGVAFKMEKGKVITINLGEFVGWVEQKILNLTTPGSSLRTFFATHSPSPTLDGIILDFWDLSISAKLLPANTTQLSFSFCIKVTLKDAFYDGIFGSNSASIKNVIDIKSLGFGMSYSS